jgi:hypothetical protein
MPFLAQFPNLPMIVQSVRTRDACNFCTTLNYMKIPPRSMCKFTSVTMQHHLDLRVCLCLHKNSFSRSVPMLHLNIKIKTQKGAWAIGHAPTQIPFILALFKFCAPPIATSHSGDVLVVVVVIVVRGAKVPGSNQRASPPWRYLVYHICFNHMVYMRWYIIC